MRQRAEGGRCSVLDGWERGERGIKGWEELRWNGDVRSK